MTRLAVDRDNPWKTYTDHEKGRGLLKGVTIKSLAVPSSIFKQD